MNMLWNKIHQTLHDLRVHPYRTGLAQKHTDDEPPLRSELFSSDQMMRHGKAPADTHKLSAGRVKDRLLSRLADNEAIPIMLRLALVENLRRVAARITAHRVERNRAGYWTDQMAEIATQDPKSLILKVGDK
jgi:hypothetical protein